jgi:geranylgeranyl pyrophosphate synthase
MFVRKGIETYCSKLCGIRLLNFEERARNVKHFAENKIKTHLRNLNYSRDVLHAYNVICETNSTSKPVSLGITLMDIAWQVSGNIPSEKDLGEAFFPIHCFFLGTAYQDDLLDSLDIEIPRNLVERLGKSTCIIMGNILYCEALLSLHLLSKDHLTKERLLDCGEKLVRDVMESEIIRRNHIGKILPKTEFFRLWRRLTPNELCVTIGGILGNSSDDEIDLLVEIALNFSLMGRILKEISEVYGLKGNITDKFKHKPPQLPITLAFEAANALERKKIVKAVQKLVLYPQKDSNSENYKDLDILIHYIAKYDSISNCLKILHNILKETRDSINQLSDLDHKDLLIKILESKIPPTAFSAKNQ